MADRYQAQPRIVRLWRHRHLVRVPWDAWRLWLGSSGWSGISWSDAWCIALGEGHERMNWFYTLEELRAELAEKE